MLVGIDNDGVIRGIRLVDPQGADRADRHSGTARGRAMNRLVGAAIAPIARGEARAPQVDIVSARR